MSDLYVTPARFRTLGTGLTLSQSDAELQAILFSASQAVNAAVNAPDDYSFLGGSVTAEPHAWKTTSRAPKQTDGRIWLLKRPVLAVTAVRINVTKTQHIDFDEMGLFLETEAGYVEPVGAPSTTALFTSVPPWLLTSPISYTDYTYGFHQVATEETMAQISGGILQANHQFWFTDEDVELKKDGVVVDPGDYTIDYYEGTITPATPPAGEVWKASYHYKLPPGIASAVALVATDIIGASAIAAAGLLGLSGIKVEEVELRQSSKINFAVQPISAAAKIHLGRYQAMFTSMR